VLLMETYIARTNSRDVIIGSTTALRYRPKSSGNKTLEWFDNLAGLLA